MKKVFEITYEGHHILVENTWFNGEKLFVDGELQDQNLGFAFDRATLYGVIKNNEGANQKIKVSLGGAITVGCRIFVDHELIYRK
ncbi:hypothetical protein M3172_24530 [Mesobacillus subterraneus]|uniref:hypothetical protein n=1 Tax=Mesobacillus subterraneus TaxID=285983 RepID=UPI00203EE59E|nr:hypothetical protein [Mesobacillus subterraneus]MCM3576337.1 hypothetical protein [Mesobacillus subterraneus]